jgi:PfaB family protein
MMMKPSSGQPLYAVIGLGLSTRDWPDLRAFKRCLLKVKSDQETADAPQNMEDRLALALQDMLEDAGLASGAQKGISIPAVIHCPEGKASVKALLKNSPDPIDRKQSVLVSGSFMQAMEKALSLLNEGKCKQVALCGSIANGEGFGCALLSQKAAAAGVYAQLSVKNEPSANGASGAGLLDLMQAVLSLNSRTRFPEPANAESGILIPELVDSEASLWEGSKSNNGSEEDVQHLMQPWFPQPFSQKYELDLALDQDTVSLHLEKAYSDAPHPGQPFCDFGLHLLPVNIPGAQKATEILDKTIKELSTAHDLNAFIRKALSDWQENAPAGNTLVVLGDSKQALLAELERAQSGLPGALESGRDWQTPNGSFFTPQPLGPQAGIAFVYPGAFGTYVGMGREVFYLFPQLHDALLEVSDDPGKTINETVIFPQKLTPSLKEQLQEELNGNPTEMISSGVCFSHLFTVILRDIFKLEPQSAFGYSLGENSMMFGLGIWSQADGMRTSLEAAPIFHQRVSGPQNAIRESWGLPVVEIAEDGKQPLWANYILMAPSEKVREALEEEPRVYITHINTPRQVVIGGEPAACLRVAEALKCMHLQTPYQHAIHCAPVESETDAFTRLHDWPVEHTPQIPIYSAAEYAPLQYESKAIARSFAHMLTHPIDFPRLVDLAYRDGARVFIELGAGSNCSKWVEACLKGQPHAAMSINQNNLDDHSAILRMLARLISHQIPLDLSILKEEFA